MNTSTGLPTVGMIGAGQLARMTHQAAIGLGQSLRVLADSAEDGAAVVAGDVQVGDYRKFDDLAEFARGCDVVTFDHEHVPNAHIAALAASDVTVLPAAHALQYAQNKVTMRTKLTELGLPCPLWLDLSNALDRAGELELFAATAGWPVVLKAASGGYDGRGVWLVNSVDEAAAVLSGAAGLLVEQAVSIDRELAALVARSPFGQGAAWPVVETVQVEGICTEVIAPAPDLPVELAERAEQLALSIAAQLDVVGVMAVELFLTTSGDLIINELAMRPHNSGHWTIEGSLTSQFEQHLRAVLDYPLGATAPTAPVAVMANVLGGPEDVSPPLDERVHHLMARWPDVKLHLYGKKFLPGRKVGHVTALGADLDVVRGRARAAAQYLSLGDQAAVSAHA